jgi:steroid delta-isomerase-like uncharacterized protein
VHNEENLMRHRALVSTIVALAIVLLAGPNVLRAQEASPPAEESSILTEYGAAWSSGDAAQVAALYTEDAVREDVPTGTTSRGRAEIEALAAGLFETDADVRLVVTDGFVGETWAVVEWTFTGTRQETGGEVTFRGASVLELEDGQIRQETDYYDLPQMQQQIAAAGGTPGALETPTGGADATAEQTASVTIRVLTCPAEMSDAARQMPADLAALLANCAPLDAPETVPTISLYPDGEPIEGVVIEPGVYGWDGLALGDYVMVTSGPMSAEMGGMLVTDASGNPLQNPVIHLDGTSSQVEYYFFYVHAEATPAA